MVEVNEDSNKSIPPPLGLIPISFSTIPYKEPIAILFLFILIFIFIAFLL